MGAFAGKIQRTAARPEGWQRRVGTDYHAAHLLADFTTAGTLGHGFFLMLNTCERAYL